MNKTLGTYMAVAGSIFFSKTWDFLKDKQEDVYSLNDGKPIKKKRSKKR